MSCGTAPLKNRCKEVLPQCGAVRVAAFENAVGGDTTDETQILFAERGLSERI